MKSLMTVLWTILNTYGAFANAGVEQTTRLCHGYLRGEIAGFALTRAKPQDPWIARRFDKDQLHGLAANPKSQDATLGTVIFLYNVNGTDLVFISEKERTLYTSCIRDPSFKENRLIKALMASQGR